MRKIAIALLMLLLSTTLVSADIFGRSNVRTMQTQPSGACSMDTRLAFVTLDTGVTCRCVASVWDCGVPEYVITTTIEAPTDSESLYIWKAPTAVTIANINCIVDPGDSSEDVTILVKKCDADGLSCAGVDGATTIVCGNTNTADDGSLSAASITSGQWLLLTSSAKTGTPDQLIIAITYAK